MDHPRTFLFFILFHLIESSLKSMDITNKTQQPTSFTLSTHLLSTTIEDTALLSSLSIYSTARLATLDPRLQTNAIPHRVKGPGKAGAQDPAPTKDSVLFLRVRAAADYFTTDEALMRDVPPVAVDVILDPFLGNVFPRSLLPTAGWIVVVSVIAFFVARWVAAELKRVVEDARRAREVLEDKKGS